MTDKMDKSEQLELAVNEQLKILDHWGATPDPVRVSGVVFQNAAFTMRKMLEEIKRLQEIEERYNETPEPEQNYD